MVQGTFEGDTIYRGYDIRWSPDGTCYRVWANGKLVDDSDGEWPNLEAARNAIDSRVRSRVAAGLPRVGD